MSHSSAPIPGRKLGAGLLGGEGFILQKVTGPGLAFAELDGDAVEHLPAVKVVAIDPTGAGDAFVGSLAVYLGEGHPLKEAPRDWGQTVVMRDLNGDGCPDIYVCNDYWTIDRIWINDGHGHFKDVAIENGTHLHPVPWSAIQVKRNGKDSPTATIDTSKYQLMPSVMRDQSMDLSPSVKEIVKEMQVLRD